jgi:hypothetical protein
MSTSTTSTTPTQPPIAYPRSGPDLRRQHGWSPSAAPGCYWYRVAHVVATVRNGEFTGYQLSQNRQTIGVYETWEALEAAAERRQAGSAALTLREAVYQVAQAILVVASLQRGEEPAPALSSLPGAVQQQYLDAAILATGLVDQGRSQAAYYQAGKIVQQDIAEYDDKGDPVFRHAYDLGYSAINAFRMHLEGVTGRLRPLGATGPINPSVAVANAVHPERFGVEDRRG